MTNPSDGNVTPIRPGMELVEWEPADVPEVYGRADEVTVYASILDVPRIAPRSEMRAWFDDCRGALGLRWYRAQVHFTHAPLYAGRASIHSPRGLWVVLRFWFAWVRDVEMLDLIYRVAADNSIASNAQQSAHAKHRYDRMWRVRRRWAVTTALVLTAVLLYRYELHHHLWLAVLIGLGVVVGLGLIGAQRGEVVQFVDVPVEIRLTADLVVRAFIKAKIPKITEEEPPVVVGVPHDVGRGWLCRVQLPEGATFGAVLTALPSLASGLNCPEASLDLDDLPMESARLMEIFVAKEHPLLAPIPEWPLLLVERWDVWRPVPIGWDIRGREVHVALLWLHTLIGAAPQRGKSTLMRLMAIAALLDPRVDVIIVDFKGGIDWIPYRPFCLRFIHGIDPDAAVAEFEELLTWLETERVKRMAAITKMDLSDVPQGRITPAMAERAGFRPIVVFVDEMQEATQSTNGKAIVTSWAKLEKKSPAAGITIVKATQKPDDKSAPTELRDVSLQRIALSVPSRHASEAVLGTEAYQQGLNAAALGGKPGLGILWAMDSEDGPGFRGRLRIPNCTPQIASMMLERVARIRRPAAEAVIDAEVIEAKPVPKIVADVLRVWPPGELVAHIHDLAEALGVTRAEVSGPLRALGLKPNPQLKIRGVNRSGYDLIDVQKLSKCD